MAWNKHQKLAAWFGLILSSPVVAQIAEEQTWDAKFQATYIWQAKRSFGAAYSGPNSLSTQREKSYSFTATAFLGVRAWTGGEFYLNPEVVQGVPLSDLTGLGGFTNGEIQKTAGPSLTVYRARTYLRQTWGLGGERESVESDANQLAGSRDKRRLVLTIGNFAVTDVFDQNTYAHDPRTTFLNWALIAHGAYDFAADARGYSWGAALEYVYDDWALRAGRFEQPKESNGLPLDSRIFVHYGDQIELEHAHKIAGQSGKVRLLGYRNVAVMGAYRDALEQAAQSGAPPDLTRVRRERAKYGFGINIEQAVSRSVGAFIRASWSDGQSETYAYTEIDRSFAGGVAIKGDIWDHANDMLGVALVRNGLSNAHRNYLASGGLGFFLGDGRLTYRPEDIIETYYALAVAPHTLATLDYQRIRSPGYNADRGPASFVALRLHIEF